MEGWLYHHYGSYEDSTAYKLCPLYEDDLEFGAGPPSISMLSRVPCAPTLVDSEVEVSCVIMDNSTIQEALIHFSVDGQNWEFLGAVAANKPSDIFRTGWPSNETLKNCAFLQIGISVEPIENLVKLEGGARPVADRMNFAKGIAMNLFHYMESFEKRAMDGGNFLVLPSNALDKWLSRFEAKYRRDPNFFMKKKD